MHQKTAIGIHIQKRPLISSSPLFGLWEWSPAKKSHLYVWNSIAQTQNDHILFRDLLHPSNQNKPHQVSSFKRRHQQFQEYILHKERVIFCLKSIFTHFEYHIIAVITAAYFSDFCPENTVLLFLQSLVCVMILLWSRLCPLPPILNARQYQTIRGDSHCISNG